MIRLLPLILLVAAISVAGLYADTVTVSGQIFDIQCLQSDGGTGISCQSGVSFPQFNPSLGTLVGMTYSLTDYNDVQWGYNDTYGGAGTEYTGSFVHELDFPDGSLNLTQTTNLDFIAEGTRQIGTGAQLDDIQTFTGSGSLPFNSYYIGDSFNDEWFSSEAYGGGWDIAMVGLANSGTVDITYDYSASSPVPEPRGVWLVLGMIGLLILRRKLTPKGAIPS
jgi:hypothetical protein